MRLLDGINYKSFYMLTALKRSLAGLNKTAAVILAFSFLASLSAASGQTPSPDKPPLRERLFFGGTLGLQFGTYTNIQVTPMMGLWVLPRVAVAAGPNYQYYKDPYLETSIYGGDAYVQYVPLRDLNNIFPIGIHTGIFLQLEDELLSLESAVWNQLELNKRFVINTVLAGVGLSQQIGRRASVNLTFLWALNNNTYGFYNNPEIRVSFNF